MRRGKAFASYSDLNLKIDSLLKCICTNFGRTIPLVTNVDKLGNYYIMYVTYKMVSKNTYKSHQRPAISLKMYKMAGFTNVLLSPPESTLDQNKLWLNSVVNKLYLRSSGSLPKNVSKILLAVKCKENSRGKRKRSKVYYK